MDSRITFEGRDRELEGYLALPDDGGEGLPAVVVIQEIRGLDEHIEDVAQYRPNGHDPGLHHKRRRKPG